jgi:Cu/Ag efflux protein CusF
MRNPKNRSIGRFVVLTIAIAICAGFSMTACNKSKPAEPEQGPKRYALTGHVVSVEKAKNQVTVDAGDIPGFMGAMTMGYDVKDPSVLATLSANDQIKADVVVNQNDVHLENIVVTKKADPAKSPK